MNAAEKYDVLVLGGGTAGKVVAWTMAKEGKRTAVVDRKYVGGSCPNVACLPSKNVIHSAKVASLVGRHREFGIETGPIAIDMAGVYARKREMVEGIVQVHLDKYRAVLDQIAVMNSSSATAHSWRLAPFKSHCATGANVRSPPTGCS